ncbi:hypothetical protein Tco_0240501 [Tanacetum coccineum]
MAELLLEEKFPQALQALCESSIPLRDIISELPLSVAIAPDLPITDSLIMKDKHLNIIPKMESDKENESSVKDLNLIPSEFEDTSDNDSECDLLFDNPLFDEEFEDISSLDPPELTLVIDEHTLLDTLPLPCTDVLGDAIVDIDLVLGEHLDTLSTGDREIDIDPIRDIEELERLLAYDPVLVPVPRVFDEPLELTKKKFDDDFEDLCSLDPLKATLLLDESILLVTPLPDVKQICLKEVERFDPFFSLTQSGDMTWVMEKPSYRFPYMPSPHPAAYSLKEVMYRFYHPHHTSDDGFDHGPKIKCRGWWCVEAREGGALCAGERERGWGVVGRGGQFECLDAFFVEVENYVFLEEFCHGREILEKIFNESTLEPACPRKLLTALTLVGGGSLVITSIFALLTSNPALETLYPSTIPSVTMK